MPEKVGFEIAHDVLVDLFDHFSELDDQEEPRFGEYARVSKHDNALTVMHAEEAWGVRIEVSYFEDDDD